MHDWLLLIESWADVWAASLWRAAWQGSIALGLAWGIARTCTFLSPRIVCWVWRVACLKLLLTLIWVQPVSLAVLPPQPPAAVAVEASSLPTAVASGSVPVEPAAERLARAIVPQRRRDNRRFDHQPAHARLGSGRLLARCGKCQAMDFATTIASFGRANFNPDLTNSAG